MATGIYSRRRVIALMGIFGMVFFSLVGRMGWLQLVHGDWLAKQGFLYRMRRTPIQADRGEILDRSGQPLLRNVVCESIFVQPPLIKNKAAAAAAVAPILGMKPQDVETRMTRRTYFEWLRRKVKPEIAKQIQDLNIKGIGRAPEKCREYPEGELAVHALGIANIDHQGIEGLELWYNSKLKGQDGAIQCEYTARGQPMDGGECIVFPGKEGLTLRTTLDIGMQRLADKATERAALETNANRTTIMVMDVKTGGLLALSQWPRYDPLLGGNSDMRLRRIFTVADTLPPGSIFKPVTAIASLERGIINKDTVINDTGCMQVNGWSICNWDHKALGPVTIREVMAKSSNVGFGTLGMRLGREGFYEFHTKFGLNKPTGIDLPGEAVGSWIPKKNASDIDLATQGFGQTLTISPIQMLTAIAAIANDGKRMKPHLGDAFLDANGHVVEKIQPQVVERVASPANARLIQELMVGVVETGTGKNARVPGYQVGGKTGTATKVIDGKVAKGRYIASFVGFAPYPNPEVAVLISVDEPKGAYYGGQIAAPIFGEVMHEILQYLNVPPSYQAAPKPANPWDPAPPKPREKAIVPSIVNLPVNTAQQVAKQAGFELFVDGGGSMITEQFPTAGSTAYKGGQMAANTVLPEPGGEQVHVPDLRGKSLLAAAQLLAQRGLLLQAEGTGVAVEQSAAAGAQLPRGSVVKVKFQPPPRTTKP
jgi:stage V sporulation protein D (sporulation-specific penicillin-binding protein)